jgi:hypothetical protein
MIFDQSLDITDLGMSRAVSRNTHAKKPALRPWRLGDPLALACHLNINPIAIHQRMEALEVSNAWWRVHGPS